MGLRPWRMALIVAAGTVLGLLWNGLSGRGLALRQSVFLREGEAEVVPVAEAHRRWTRGALLLDARASDFYELGHVPGARSFPEDAFETAFAGLEPELRSRPDVIVYCSGYGCEASHIVARKLRDHGIPASILENGWPAWSEGGLPVRAGRDP